MSAPPQRPTGWLALACRPGKADGHLVFPYEVTNNGPVPVLVMDAWRKPGRGDPLADPDVAQVVLREDGVAVAGKYLPALPEGMVVATRALPLCTLVKPGETLARELRIRLPFAEQSSYLPELLLSRYEPLELRGLVLAVGWWPLGHPGIVAAPAPWAPAHHLVAALHRLPPAGTAQLRFPTTRLDILRRRDAFPRGFPDQPDLEVS
ncbi:hypothetical protein [Falsiroseomonas oryzae]|uniref:hypothetical protein n=1 Tax=Falsiroseomonas oryzae TaxID=2766473 RepID=UPI0022EB42BA|nr:hypothetical protein [Roseomonas sp. MO-31]